VPKSVSCRIPNADPVPVPPSTKKIHVFTKDLERLIADLGATADKAAVIERYSVALAAKNKVRYELESGSGSIVLTYPKARASVRKAGENREGRQRGRTHGGP
jgi:hypothetical protein